MNGLKVKMLLELTVIHIDRHSNLVKNCNSILKSLTVGCKSKLNGTRQNKYTEEANFTNSKNKNRYMLHYLDK